MQARLNTIEKQECDMREARVAEFLTAPNWAVIQLYSPLMPMEVL